MKPHESTAEGQVRVERRETVATVVLDHPGRLNAVTVDMWRALARHFAELSADRSIRCVLVRGAGGHFAAGADIREFPRVRADLASVLHYHRHIIAPALDAVRECSHPVVAAIEGICVGGGLEIASCCDVRVAAANARFGVPINRLGFPMAPDEMRGLLALAGRAVTLEILLEGRIFGAGEAMSKGLLTRVVEPDALADELHGTVERLCAGAPLAATLNKRIATRLVEDASPLAESEWREFFSYAATEDHRRGVQAFLEGDEPVFTGG